jgi:hypothetical protein
MPQGWYGLICCICFETLTPQQCFVDADGQKWDLCGSAEKSCAEQAGY